MDISNINFLWKEVTVKDRREKLTINDFGLFNGYIIVTTDKGAFISNDFISWKKYSVDFCDIDFKRVNFINTPENIFATYYYSTFFMYEDENWKKFDLKNSIGDDNLSYEKILDNGIFFLFISDYGLNKKIDNKKYFIKKEYFQYAKNPTDGYFRSKNFGETVKNIGTVLSNSLYYTLNLNIESGIYYINETDFEELDKNINIEITNKSDQFIDILSYNNNIIICINSNVYQLDTNNGIIYNFDFNFGFDFNDNNFCKIKSILNSDLYIYHDYGNNIGYIGNIYNIYKKINIPVQSIDKIYYDNNKFIIFGDKKLFYTE